MAANSTGALLSAYSNTTPSGPSFDPSSNLVDHVDASQALGWTVVLSDLLFWMRISDATLIPSLRD
jgi:hypothetical protein